MTAAILLSGGTGTRAGLKIPKQYIEVNGRMIISYSMQTILSCERISRVQIVAADEWRDRISEEMTRLSAKRRTVRYGFSDPGENRQLSVYHALLDLRGNLSRNDYVLIHDAARPFMSGELLNRTLDAAEGHDGAIPVLPVTDTMYQSMDGRTLDGCIPRGQIYAGQAPEAFRFGPYLEANEELLPDRIREINGSTEPALMAGMDMAILPGEPGNFKVTIAEDMDRVRQIIMEDPAGK
ncbi:IspD/TarI family cytidylyltransferase [Bilifractor sp. LCP21S3_A7]|uniref:IspD/TarI family cytidylyltransferase n=1 Tax=Bilifractor sp. LCP21S3_A7 TaxID=3438738 RepID=UPI003F8DB806